MFFQIFLKDSTTQNERLSIYKNSSYCLESRGHLILFFSFSPPSWVGSFECVGQYCLPSTGERLQYRFFYLFFLSQL